MPDFLSDDLTALRDRVAALARGPLAALRDDAALAGADRAAQVTWGGGMGGGLGGVGR